MNMLKWQSLGAAAAVLTIYGCSDTGTPPSPPASGGSSSAGSPPGGVAGSNAPAGSGGQVTAAGSGSSGAPTGGTPTTAGGTGGTGGAGGTSSGGVTNGGGGGTSGGASGAGGSAGGTGGASGGWVSILPKDDALTGWVPYLKGYTPGMDPLKTFRRDATGALVVTYADYPDGGSYGNHLGLIYYDKKLTNYRVRLEYSFQEPQAKAPVPSWGKNNSGLFVFGTDPHLITGNPDFPTAIEIQLLGKPSAGGSINCQICLNSTVGMYPAKIGNMNITGPGGCFASTQNQNDLQAAATWTTVEAEVDGSPTGVTKIYQYAQDGTKPATPIQTFTGPVKTGGQTVNGGWISFQSESQPITFRKIDLMELP
jgi:hypothetical protein